MTAGSFVYMQTQGASLSPDKPGVLSKIIYTREDGTDRRSIPQASFVGRTDSRILAMDKCRELTFSCAGGRLLSFNPLNPLAAAIWLGMVPTDTAALFFGGFGEKALVEGDTFGGPSLDGDGPSHGPDIFYLQGDRENSLERVTQSPGLPDTLP
jgi:hypothetical protein